jgi:hypothetical protein
MLSHFSVELEYRAGLHSPSLVDVHPLPNQIRKEYGVSKITRTQ